MIEPELLHDLAEMALRLAAYYVTEQDWDRAERWVEVAWTLDRALA
jgi:hypothetical protein